MEVRERRLQASKRIVSDLLSGTYSKDNPFEGLDRELQLKDLQTILFSTDSDAINKTLLNYET